MEQIPNSNLSEALSGNSNETLPIGSQIGETLREFEEKPVKMDQIEKIESVVSEQTPSLLEEGTEREKGIGLEAARLARQAYEAARVAK